VNWQDKKEFPWDLSVQFLKKVGPKRAYLLSKLKIQTLESLLTTLPFRYEDRTETKKIGEILSIARKAVVPAAEGNEGAPTNSLPVVFGEIRSVSVIQTRKRGLTITSVTLADETGTLSAKWFNQPYLKELFKKGDALMVSGPIRSSRYGDGLLEMESPQYEKIDSEEPQLHLNRIVPIYSETKGLTSRQIRSIIKSALDQYGTAVPDPFPLDFLEKHRFISLAEAISQVHFPQKGTPLSLLQEGKTLAHQRLAFDELFLLEMGLALRKKEAMTREKGIAFNPNSTLVTRLKQQLPFQLTLAQERVFVEIQTDMGSVYPMQRLIQGDVGSGKTLVALMAILIAIENGYQAALMAPTEILAEQHFLYLTPYFEALGCSLLLLTSDMKKKGKAEAIEKIASGAVHLVIGTHALIQESVCFKNLGLAVVDEQHKFGVLQRARLAQKGARPDILVMTATPIPRTLALTLYGDLNISVIDALPPGRSPIITRLLHEKDRAQVYPFMEKELQAGRQVYVVCPLVETSEKVDLKAACETEATLRTITFAHRRVGLLHGKMKREIKEAVMRAFRDKQIDILVATTVVEVGVDQPNATVMVIEHAERFGLSQLHQLRGRVGRGSARSYCFLMADYAQSEEGRARLRVMQETTDGFRVAEEDLKIRGPGAFFGTRQSGLPEITVASLVRDLHLLDAARKEAFDWVEADPNLTKPKSLLIRASLERKWKGKIEWLTTG
jgi:ATP-dependent DNA helicase RecG